MNETALEAFGLDVLDRVPTDLQVLGHVLDGHLPGQVQSVALEGAGVAFLGIGKADLHLAHAVADGAPDTGHVESQEGRFATNGHHAEGTFLVAADPDVLAVALRAAKASLRRLSSRPAAVH